MANVRLQNPRPEDLNFLRKYFAMNGGGSDSTMSGTFDDPPQYNALAQMAQSQQMQQPQMQPPPSALETAVPGQGYQGLQAGQGVMQATNPDGTQGPVIRMNFPAPPPERGSDRDIMRNKIDFGRYGGGYYGKDGQLYLDNGQRFQTDEQRSANAAQSMAEQDRQMKIAEMQARTEHTQSQTSTEREKLRQIGLPEGRPKPPPGFDWTQDGKLAAIQGGPADMKIGREAEKETDSSKAFVSLGTLALENVDAMIGARGPDGKLVAGSKPHAGFESAVGAGFPGLKYLSGSDTADFNARLDQAGGRAFLEAFEKLKGGGAITEVEGKKATAAITRMSTSQSEKEFIQAAQEFRSVIADGVQRAQGKLGKGGAPIQQGAQPMPTSKQSLVAGQSYRTPRGLAVWNGSAFEAQ